MQSSLMLSGRLCWFEMMPFDACRFIAPLLLLPHRASSAEYSCFSYCNYLSLKLYLNCCLSRLEITYHLIQLFHAFRLNRVVIGLRTVIEKNVPFGSILGDTSSVF